MTADLTAPTDHTHLDCVAALAVIRADFDAAHRAVGSEAARFAADIEHLAADIEHLVADADGWDAARRLAERQAAP